MRTKKLKKINENYIYRFFNFSQINMNIYIYI